MKKDVFVMLIRCVLLPLLFFVALPSMSATDQKISALNSTDKTFLAQQRQTLEKYLGDDRSKENYKTAAGKLGLLRALLDQKVFKPDQTHAFECMGVILGDAFAQKLHMEWIVVEDAKGRDLALRIPKTSIIIFPASMILKRVSRGESVDVFALFNGITDQIESLKKQGVK
ncbi:DUF3806 domain-containing protein [Uliginosibacterium sp. 31-16]|uniref:DUF3806 domain-containing protein n=1 Tax=Uliginosibacterium sp. 31-16 TaxID=3068315 RepID=UPI00273EAFC2|nr:DUF3806 domain-containing protein [Uliginosibacterium sp. 31-16]MDP5240169.1 DUF3806 domain-containing protein [Uliginosibacterium sp. 31-16]